MALNDENMTTAVGSQIYDKASEGLQVSGSGGQDKPAIYEADGTPVESNGLAHTIEGMESNKAWYAYFLTRDFWIVLVLG
jgi:hypothetical protein